jgi:ADP-ribosyl-[dinitrogen reductase] hydrolase
MTHRDRDRFLGCFVGLAVGDALGAPVEFLPRGRFTPIHDMVTGGQYQYRLGEWTDDTAMALCLADSLLARGGTDPRDQMERYARWAFTAEGYMSSRPKAFGLGQTFFRAMMAYRRSGDPLAGSIDPRRPGNGAIMRLAPVALFYFPDEAAIVANAEISARTTHGAAESVYAARLLATILLRALQGLGKKAILSGLPVEPGAPANIQQIAQVAWRTKGEDEIQSTFFAAPCLEAALWCFDRTESYEEAVLRAVNLGGDADSTAAVCGQVAGAHYGYSRIPTRWVDRLVKKELILEMAERLFAER